MAQSSEASLVSLESLRGTYEQQRKAAIADGDEKMAKACQDRIAHIEDMILRELASNA